MSAEPSSVDLRALLRAVGASPRAAGALLTPPAERIEVDHPVEMLDAASSEVVAQPLAVTAFVDGIQHARILTWRQHRPVFLTYVAAAGVGARRQVHALDERLALVCGPSDSEWAASVASGVGVRVLDADVPGHLERAAFALLGAEREEAERSVTIQLLGSSETSGVVLDGTLVARPHDDRLTGVVKSTQRRYLSDESVLWELAPGWRSPRFVIPAGMGAGVPRYSCYLRLFPAHQKPWNFALVRLESFTPDALDELAARCLAERQGPGAHDLRWERHLGAVRQVEDYLRSRRPPVFS